MLLNNFDAVFFDLDGTLVDSMWVWAEVDKVFLGTRNIPIPTDMDEDLEGKSFTETAIYFQNRFKLDMSVEAIKDEWNALASELYTTKVSLKVGVKEFLDFLKANNKKMAVATSNSPELAASCLNSLGVLSYFDIIKTGCEVGKGKPNPDIYLACAATVGVEPSRCLIFEDIPNGILAGKNAAMTAWLIKDTQDKNTWQRGLDIADHHVSDYFEAIKLLSAD